MLLGIDERQQDEAQERRKRIVLALPPMGNAVRVSAQIFLGSGAGRRSIVTNSTSNSGVIMSQLAIDTSHVATLHYVLADERGRTLDDSRARQQPLEYLHGHGNLFPALESALAARRSGERLSVTLAPDETYGERDEALVGVSSRSAFPQDQQLKAGQRFQAQGPDGPRTVTVVATDDARVTVDANHPLAGETLTYDIEILAVREATRAELAKGHPLPPGTSHTAVEDRKR